jgi:hypothetical protein
MAGSLAARATFIGSIVAWRITSVADAAAVAAGLDVIR